MAERILLHESEDIFFFKKKAISVEMKFILYLW